jgi:PAS domain-containing protein
VILGVVAGLGAWVALAVVHAQWRRAIRPVFDAVDPEDVADFMRAEVARRLESERRTAVLRAALDSLPAGLLVTSHAGVVIEHNSALPDLLEAPSRNVVGWSAHELSRETGLREAVELVSRSAEPVSVTVTLGALRVMVSSIAGHGSLALVLPSQP